MATITFSILWLGIAFYKIGAHRDELSNRDIIISLALIVIAMNSIIINYSLLRMVDILSKG